MEEEDEEEDADEEGGGEDEVMIMLAMAAMESAVCAPLPGNFREKQQQLVLPVREK